MENQSGSGPSLPGQPGAVQKGPGQTGPVQTGPGANTPGSRNPGISLNSVRDKQFPIRREPGAIPPQENNLSQTAVNPRTAEAKSAQGPQTKRPETDSGSIRKEEAVSPADLVPVKNGNGPEGSQLQLPEPKRLDPQTIPTNSGTIGNLPSGMGTGPVNLGTLPGTKENCPPGMAKPSVSNFQDPHIRTGPTAQGCMLNVGPNETPSEKAVEIAQKLQVSELENKVLMNRIRKLEEQLDERDKAIREANKEVELAAGEVAKTRSELQQVRKELVSLRERIKQAEKEDIETLRAIITALERLIEGPKPK